MPKSAAELREELRAAEAREREDLKLRKERTPIVYKFTILPEVRPGSTKMYSADYTLFELNAEVTNLEEAKAAGHHDPRGGGHDIVFNHVTGQIVCYVGGGMLWISERWGAFQQHEEDDVDDRAMRDISEFLKEHPEGGDITDIVVKYRKMRGH